MLVRKVSGAQSFVSLLTVTIDDVAHGQALYLPLFENRFFLSEQNRKSHFNVELLLKRFNGVFILSEVDRKNLKGLAFKLIF